MVTGAYQSSLLNLITLSAIVGLALLVFLGYKYLRSPMTYHTTPQGLRHYLETLLTRGYDGGYMIIQVPKGGQFIQFAKYIKENGEYGLEFAFPKTRWSEPYFEPLRETLRAENIEFTVTAVDSPPTVAFLEVDCGDDIGRAELVMSRACEALRLSPVSQVDVQFRGLTLHDELIAHK